MGAGAIGGLLTSRLARCGLDPALVARGASGDAIRAFGLRVLGPGEDSRARPRTSPDAADFGVQDTVFVCVKSHQLQHAAPLLAPLLGPDTSVVFIVNGIPWWYAYRHPDADARQALAALLDPQGVIGSTVGLERTIGSVVMATSSMVEPGVIQITQPAFRMVLGEPCGQPTRRLQSIVEHLLLALPDATAGAPIQDAVWTKAVANLATSTLSCLTEAPAREFMAEASNRALLRRLLEEAAAIALAEGSTVSASDGLFERVAQSPHLPSMLVDLRRGKQIEFDAQVGALQRLARHHGLSTPSIDLVAALLRSRARLPASAP